MARANLPTLREVTFAPKTTHDQIAFLRAYDDRYAFRDTTGVLWCVIRWHYITTYHFTIREISEVSYEWR